MKTAQDIVRGRIVDIDSKGYMTIRARYDDWKTLIKRGYRECFVQMIDSRPVSRQQMNLIYKLLREIADFSGDSIDSVKETLKKKFLEEELRSEMIDGFSLSDAPVSLCEAFKRYLIRFMVDQDIPANFSLLELADESGDYMYACVLNRKCCICGKPADVHHVRALGMGRDREDVVHEGMEVLPLCRIHHTEAHKLGRLTFKSKYHIGRGVELDSYLCDMLNLPRSDENGSQGISR